MLGKHCLWRPWCLAGFQGVSHGTATLRSLFRHSSAFKCSFLLVSSKFLSINSAITSHAPTFKACNVSRVRVNDFLSSQSRHPACHPLQQQPAIVFLHASARSFQNYIGVSNHSRNTFTQMVPQLFCSCDVVVLSLASGSRALLFRLVSRVLTSCPILSLSCHTELFGSFSLHSILLHLGSL